MSLKDLLTVWQQKLLTDPSIITSIMASLQFSLTGDEGEDYNVILRNGSVQINQGIVNEPDVRVSMNSADFKKLTDGKLSAMGALLSGKLKVQGDKPLAMRLLYNLC